MTTAHMKDNATPAWIRVLKNNSAIEIGTKAILYVAPDEAEMVTKVCSLEVKGPGLRLKLFSVNGILISQAGRYLAIQSPT